MRIRIVKEYAHQIETEKDVYGMLPCTEHIVVCTYIPRIVHTLQNSRLHAMENATMHCKNARTGKQNE